MLQQGERDGNCEGHASCRPFFRFSAFLSRLASALLLTVSHKRDCSHCAALHCFFSSSDFRFASLRPFSCPCPCLVWSVIDRALISLLPPLISFIHLSCTAAAWMLHCHISWSFATLKSCKRVIFDLTELEDQIEAVNLADPVGSRNDKRHKHEQSERLKLKMLRPAAPANLSTRAFIAN